MPRSQDMKNMHVIGVVTHGLTRQTSTRSSFRPYQLELELETTGDLHTGAVSDSVESLYGAICFNWVPSSKHIVHTHISHLH